MPPCTDYSETEDTSATRGCTGRRAQATITIGIALHAARGGAVDGAI